MPLELAFNLDHAAWQKVLPQAEALAEQAFKAVLQHQGHGRKKLAVELTLASDATVRKLNREWRGKDKPTNVLSFPMDDEDMPRLKGQPRQLGDIILALQTVKAEAKEQDKTIAAHYTHLLVHGMLHLLGYDHLETAEAEEMEALEVEILIALGVDNPYADGELLPE